MDNPETQGNVEHKSKTKANKEKRYGQKTYTVERKANPTKNAEGDMCNTSSIFSVL